MTSLEKVFTRSLVMSLAGPVVYGRGVSYQRQGRALLQAEGDRRVQATAGIGALQRGAVGRRWAAWLVV